MLDKATSKIGTAELYKTAPSYTDMKKTHKELIILLIGLFINSSIAWSQIMLSNGATAGPDIESAVVLCDTDQISFPAFSGSGTPTATNPGIDPEVNSIWVAWTVESDGPMTFTITPDNPAVNFDFVLFESLAFRQDGGDETIIRQSLASCPGPTGLATAPNTMSCPDSFDDAIDLFAPDVYALLIHTTSDDNAFTLSFGGTSNFEGPKPTIEHTGGDCFGSPKSLVIQNIGGANITQYEWNFGEGASITDTTVNDNYVPIIDYATTGSKTVELILETDLGCRVVTEYTFDIEACCETDNSIDVDTTNVIKASCPSENTGIIDVSVANPSALEYTVDWSHDPMESRESLNQLEAGIYQVNVENAAGCKDSIAVNLATDNILKIDNLVTFPVTECSNPNAGKIVVRASGGEAPYMYNYGIDQDFVMQDSIDNLGFGTYEITVRDNNGCEVKLSQTIDSLKLGLVASSPQNASCFGIQDGSIVIEEMLGGTAPFTYDFGGGLTGGEEILSQIPGKNDGSYIVTVTDANGCTGTVGDINITEPDAVLALLEGDPFVDCHGTSTGSLLAIPSGGTPTYEYLWSTGATSDMIENLSPGVYGVTVTDLNGCEYMDDVLISNPDSLIATTVATDLTCNTNIDGTIQVIVEGGEAPYSYSEDGITFQAFPSNNDTLLLDNLSEGDYTITIQDNKNCIIDELVTARINSPSAITATDTTTLATCGGELDGSITITASGGSAPYSFEFFQPTGSIGTNTTGTMMGLGIGDYTVTVTDANGCEQPVQGIEIEELSLEDIEVVNPTDLTCFNDSTGAVEIVINDQGAQGPFTYNFFDGNDFVDASALSSLAKGDYDIEVSDANGCQGTVPTFSIDEPEEIRAIVEPVRLSCFGDTNGATIVTASGGSNNFTYAWSNGTTERTINNLGEGAYSVIVTDDNGCSSDTINFSVTNPPPITITSIDPRSVNCPTDPVGSIEIEVTGGAGGYEYSLDNGDTFGDVGVLSGLPAGDYDIQIRDAEGCVKDTMATINSSVTIDQPFILSGGCYGDVVSFPSGEDFIIVSQSAVTSWAWTFGEGSDMAFADTPGPHDVTYNSLGTPEVNLTVTLDNGCVFTENINGVDNPAFDMAPCCDDVNAITITPTVDSTSCSNNTDGGITLDIQSAAAISTTEWDNGESTQDLQNLGIGDYTVIVTNEATCTNSVTATVESPTPIIISNITTSAPACGGGTDGVITVNASGGTGEYMYNLGGGFGTDNEADNLSIGDYTINVQDENNCITTDSTITLSERVVNVTSATIIQPNCNGDANGEIALNHDGNSPLLSVIYNGSNVITDLNENGNTVTLEDLSADNYTIEIRDAENCRGLIDTIMQEPDSITINLAGTNISCFGEADGAFATSVTGGASNYRYDWNSGENLASISNLSEGMYVITVTDGNGCTNTQNGLIVEPNELSVGPPIVQNVFCFGNTDGTVTLQGIGGSAPYTYSLEGQSFQTSPTIQNLASGDYTLFVRDSSGCEVSTEASIDEPGEFSIIVSEDQTVTLGDEIQLNAFASLPEGVVYTWNTPDSLTCNDCPNPRVKPSRSGIYEVTATNPGGCSDSGTIRVLVDFDRPIYIPNAFSPNDDGFNDRFFIEGGPAVQSIRSLSIFDRYGAMVYNRNSLVPGDVSTGWDGTFNGEALPIGVYIVRAEVVFIDGEVRTFVEDVTLAKDR